MMHGVCTRSHSTEHRVPVVDVISVATAWQVPEPTVDETIQILKGLRERYEIHHKLRYTDEALVAAAQLSYQYISDRFLPDKAIDLIDEAGSRVRLRHAQVPLPLPRNRGLEGGVQGAMRCRSPHRAHVASVISDGGVVVLWGVAA